MASKILITPNAGSTTVDPTIAFQGAGVSTDILLRVPSTGGLSFEGTTGQLFSLTDSMSGTIFSANDVSGIPSIEVLDTGLVKLAQYSGNVLLGTGTDNSTDKLQVNGPILGTVIKSNVATGTAPFTVASTTMVANLNAATATNLQPIGIPDGTNLNTILAPGSYRYEAAAVNDPGPDYAPMIVFGGGDTRTQIVGNYSNSDLWTRSGQGSGATWQPWYKLLNTNNGVTLDSNQTVNGIKTFGNNPRFPAFNVGAGELYIYTEGDNLLIRPGSTAAGFAYYNFKNTELNTNGKPITCGSITVSGSISIAYPGGIVARHIDGSNGAELYLNYSNQGSSINSYGTFTHYGNFNLHNGNFNIGTSMLFLGDTNHGMLKNMGVDGPEFRGYAGFIWKIGVNGATEHMRLQNSNLTVVGNVTAYSDERVKANWRSFSHDFVERLAGIKSGVYDRTDVELTQIGVSAQSLRTLMPNAVLTDTDGKLSVAYGNAALAACVELAKRVIQLEQQIVQHINN
jgi:hypothetical protein